MHDDFIGQLICWGNLSIKHCIIIILYIIIIIIHTLQCYSQGVHYYIMEKWDACPLLRGFE